eukprot:scaffold103166_cov39-Phaeocystis_antarctica.AAC.1
MGIAWLGSGLRCRATARARVAARVGGVGDGRPQYPRATLAPYLLEVEAQPRVEEQARHLRQETHRERMRLSVEA